MRYAHLIVSIWTAVAAAFGFIAIPVLSSYLPGDTYARIYQSLNVAGRALELIVAVAEALAIAGLVFAALKSRGRIFKEDRWILPMIGALLGALAIAAFFVLRWFLRGGLP